MIYVYIIVSAALIPILDNFFDILRESYSWWLVPLLFAAFFAVFVILHIAVAVISIALVNTKKPIGKATNYFRFMIKHGLPIVLRLAGVKIHTTGKDKVPEGRVLLVCNHRHDFDPAIIINELPDCRLGFIGKKEILTEMPFVAKAMHAFNCLPIDRENNREGVKTIVTAIKMIKDDVISVGVFPEGYTNLTKDPLLPLRNGVFKIALKAQVPIVICTLKGTPDIVKNMFRRKTDVYFDILDVITTEQLETLGTAEIGEIVSEKMIESITNK